MKKIIIVFFALSFISVFALDTPNDTKTDIQEQNNTQSSQRNWGPYMRELEQRIRRNWNPPKDGSTKRVVVTFTIGRNGTLLNKSITKSSGIPQADRAAMTAIELTAPFRPLPEEYKGDSVPIEFTFDYNVLNGSSTYIHSGGAMIGKSYNMEEDGNGVKISPSQDMLLWFKNKKKNDNK